MNGTTPKEVSEMAKLINVMNGNFEEQIMPSATHTHEPFIPPSVDAKADMKKILESIYSVGGDEVIETIKEEARTDPRLREAISTRRTDDGVQIGAWEVRVRMYESNNKTRKAYDVLQVGSSKPLYESLVILEAAHAIVRYLNKGFDPNHSKILEIADLEETYRRNRQDAVIFKKRYERCLELKETEAAEVFEARWQRARAQAIVANDQIKTILDNIR